MTTVISVEHLSKTYHLGQIGTGTLANDMKLWWAKVRGKPNPLIRIGDQDQDDRYGDELWALKDVNFTVEQGEVLGIIGPNGAGKSTLLKILSRVTAPTSGKVKVKGRIASLLEVGTGFHPELTGRENIYLNGAILGMDRKEIKRKFDEIVGFSEVEQFIDTPVKRYSSGMYVRLAFAVAAHLEPEILLLDEVLAVGDAEFQKKCLGKMGDVAHEGRTILFISHNMVSVNSICPESILLDHGSIKYKGRSDEVIKKYMSSISKHQEVALSNRTDREGNGLLKMTMVSFVDQKGVGLQVISSGEDVSLKIDYEIPSGTSIAKVACICIFKTLAGETLFSCSTRLQNEYLSLVESKGWIICKIPKFPLNEGRYTIDLLIKQGMDKSNMLDCIERAVHFDVSKGDFFGTGRVAGELKSPVLVQHAWQANEL